MRRWGILVASVVVAALTVPLSAPPATAAEIPHTRVVSDNPANNTPHVLDGDVNTIAQVGELIILGGSFSQVSNAARTQTYNRQNVVAFNASTGAITPFNPAPDSTVEAIIPAADGTSVYFGGNFNNIAGQTRRKVARIDIATATNVAGFRNVAGNGNVRDLRLVDGRLWVAGSFTSMSGSTQGKLITLNAETGNADAFMALPVEGQHNGGTTQVTKIDVSADGDRLVGIGNFTTVAGESRRQIFMLDTSAASAAVANWQTTFYEHQCASVFNTYMRDLDFAPDGSFFVVTTTGAHGGPTAPCDTQARFDTDRTGAAIRPEWINTTGGDTTYAVEVTGAAVYVGGHMRWENNPFAGDQAGAGAVAREGIAALDPANGLPLSWNPGRTRGVGVFDMLATETGLWIGSDTEWVNGEFHGRVAYFPLAGGTDLPETAAPDLPANIVLLAPKADASNSPVLYRINAAGPAVVSADSGPDWAADTDATSPYREGGSNIATYSPSVTFDGTVPAGTPASIFDQERWDDGGAPEMQWSFPVTAGTPIEVRLYFANRYAGTATPGTRVTDIRLDGALVLDDFDIIDAAGATNVGTMRAFEIVSDGTVNIDFGHVVENPLINAIEIVRTDVEAVDTADLVRTIAFSGTDVGATTESGGVIDWTGTRGAFMLNGVVYLVQGDGSFVRRTFDGATWGQPVAVDTHDALVPLTAWRTNASRITGVFYDNGRMYYTQTGDTALKMRYFTAENDVVGAAEYTASGSIAGLDLASVRGMFLAGDWVFAVQSDGSLVRVEWADGGFVPGTATTVSGPDEDGTNWLAAAPFAFQSEDGSAPNFPPTAQAAVECDNQVCEFSSAGSSDVGGTITDYLWDFGDGESSEAANPTHTYAAAGLYDITLTVTDDAGATDSVTVPTQVEFFDAEPEAAFEVSCDGRVCSFDGSGSADAEGPIAEYAWAFGDGETDDSGPQVEHTFAADGTYEITLTVTDSAGQTSEAEESIDVEHVFSAPEASFTLECEQLACSFDGSGSNDADGPLTAWEWDFGGDGTASGETAEHVFSAPGTYEVTLTVTDGQGQSAAVSESVSVAELAEQITFVGEESSNRNSLTHPTAVPADTEVGDLMVLVYTSNSTSATVTAPAGWTEQAAGQSGNGVLGRVWTRVATAADLGSTVTPTASAYVKASSSLLVYRGVDAADPVAAVESAFQSTTTTSFVTPEVAGVQNGMLVSYWGVKGNTTNTLTAPAGTQERHATTGSSNGHVDALAADSGPIAAGDAGGLTATASVASNKAFLLSLVLQPAGPQPEMPPTAAFEVSCSSLACSFDGSGSNDADGPLTAWEWDFGGDGTASGETAEHVFSAPGTYEVTLTVTDGQGQSAAVSESVSVAELAEQITFVGEESSNRNSLTHPTAVPADTEVGDLMVLVYTSNSTSATVTAPAGWTEQAAGQSGNGVLGRVWTRVATAADLGSTVTPTASAYVKASSSLLVYRGVDAADPVAAVESAFQSTTTTSFVTPEVAGVQNGMLVSYWGVKGNTTNTLTAPAGTQERHATTGSSNGHVDALAADSGPIAAGDAGGLTATASVASNKAFLLSLVLQPAA
ncbi:PKD domain-containing protein [Microbacterium sp. bgisy189]|uniref:PKD domain-containing protein n=1 Tax=Microbacterium sp. bgisy189 TaxID=3413798 RepID=UPI003EBC7F05